MTFKNAANGVKKIFTAEILALIGGICAVLGGIFILVAAVSAAAAGQTGSDGAAVGALGAGAGAVIFILGAAVLALIALILNIVGIAKASGDEQAFKIALYATIVGLVLTVLTSAFSSNQMLSNLFQTVNTIFTLLATLYVIQGIRNLADRLNKPEISNKGNTIFKIILVVLVLNFIAELIATIFYGTNALVVAGVVDIIAGVISLVQYVLYLSFLAKAKKMLAEN